MDQKKSNTAGIYIALGANIPSGKLSPVETVQKAIKAISDAGITVLASSSLWKSPAWPDPSDPPYINAVISIETALDPRTLLDCLHKIEAKFGRTRLIRWASRTLDLDLIDHRGQILTDEAGLELPHPRAVERGFVLLPLREVAVAWVDPITGEGIDTLIAGLPQGQLEGLHPLQSEPVKGLA